jgi:lipopolysaccharide export system protein LptC
MADDTYPRAISPQPAASARVSAAMEQWRRRSRLVRFFRRALPATIAAVGLLLVGWVVFKSALASLPDLASRGAVIRMTNPRFYGQDERGRSFVLGGKEATHENRGRDVVNVTDPVLSLTTAPDKTVSVSAKAGVYDQTLRRAGLAGGVHIVDSGSGWVFDTAQASIDAKSGVIHGNTAVHGKGPLGETRASSYAILDHGARVVFTGNVRSHIVQSRQ